MYGNSGPGFGQAQNCGGVKLVIGIPTTPVVIVHFVDTGGIVDHDHCLNFLFMIMFKQFSIRCFFRPITNIA
jgi:hypothetical protein